MPVSKVSVVERVDGMVFEGTTVVYQYVCRFKSK